MAIIKPPYKSLVNFTLLNDPHKNDEGEIHVYAVYDNTIVINNYPKVKTNITRLLNINSSLVGICSGKREGWVMNNFF